MRNIVLSAIFLTFLVTTPLQTLAAENLPTTSPFGYWWERVSFNIKQAFTFNAERKAQLLQNRLDSLDSKASACAEAKDEECLNKISEHQEALQARTEKFLDKRVELKEDLQEKFEEKKKRHQEHRIELRKKFEEKREGQQEKEEEQAEKLIEVRSKSAKDKLDQAQDKARRREIQIKRHLEGENGSTIDVEINETTEVSGDAEVETSVEVEASVD